MKVTPNHVEIIKNAIEPLDTPERRAQYRAGDFPRAERVTNLDVRYRWDLFWDAWAAAGRPAAWTLDYADAHLDTALRSIVPVLAEEAAV